MPGRSLRWRVSRETLIPRPETETLVTQALDVIPAGSKQDIADLGTGSGAVALAIASERPGCRITATDTSATALAVAQANAQRHGIGKAVMYALNHAVHWPQARPAWMH